MTCSSLFRTGLVQGTILLLLSAGLASAEFTMPTLQRIKETGKIRIGYGATSPFSLITAQGRVVGYSIDLCRLLTEKLRERLQMPKIEIDFVPRTPSNRIQLLNDGTMDIECNASTNTAERRKSASFAVSHFLGVTRYVSLAKNELKTLADLKGRSVSVALGTVNVSDITEVNRSQKLNMSIVPVESLQSAFDMVTDGRVSAFSMDEVLLSMMIAKSTTPSEYRMSSDMVSDEQPYGFMMRLNDNAFTDAVNQALTEIYKSPDMPMIYARWFQQLSPETGVNLNMPMSARLKDAFENPVPIK
ncbi:glutamate/aspartate transport system substrate-binding protein [Rhizobium skierniewicense]|uniref:Glutamate/aspartate transport system substrate-binding protein n=1 Tax=Rhizobium skierniewicense TaxID=984260 RepID=A0A7W6FZY1_9HYPH|nr:amino acid ABC transporter substrate-binding protein [Rhizobium skierniewicense]MBB3944298.1 glutamate/aspartate transport system substrate-binding protein [Rhizobium skierniewicense]